MTTNGFCNGIKSDLINGYNHSTKQHSACALLNNTITFDNVQKMTRILRSKISKTPEIGVVCGSGLGNLCDTMTQKEVVPYREIPGHPVSTVHGHAGNYLVGDLHGKTVIAMQGRFHTYEGYTAQQCTLPIRIMNLLGVKIVLLTNAAGSLNESYELGDIVLIRDHIYMPGLAGLGPLNGPNDEKFGTRFPSLNNTYDKDLRRLVRLFSQKLSAKIKEGVYAMVGGPQYESPSECRMLKIAGADLVGMSTAHEAIVARHCGMKVLAFSMVTNCVNFDVDAENAMEDLHAEVLEMVHRNAEILTQFVRELIPLL